MSRHDSTGAGGIYIGLVPEEAQKWGVIGGRQKRSGKEVDVQLWSGKIATLSLLAILLAMIGAEKHWRQWSHARSSAARE